MTGFFGKSSFAGPKSLISVLFFMMLLGGFVMWLCLTLVGVPGKSLTSVF
jgi:hypothetical protein